MHKSARILSPTIPILPLSFDLPYNLKPNHKYQANSNHNLMHLRDSYFLLSASFAVLIRSWVIPKFFLLAGFLV